MTEQHPNMGLVNFYSENLEQFNLTCPSHDSVPYLVDLF